MLKVGVERLLGVEHFNLDRRFEVGVSDLAGRQSVHKFADVLLRDGVVALDVELFKR